MPLSEGLLSTADAGLQTAKKINELEQLYKLPRTPIISLSAYNNQEFTEGSVATESP